MAVADAPGNDILRPPLPRRLQVEVTGSCNLRCRMCIVRYRPALGRSASMPFAEFRQLLAQLPDVNEVVLQGIGEPLLAPDIFDMVHYCGQHGIDVGFNSNATLLTRRTGERLIDGGLSWLCISLDGATAATYEFVRDQARWDVVERNISNFVALKRERGAANPALSLVMVLMQRNLHEIAGVVERAAGWGIPRVFVQGLSHDFSDAPTEAYAAISAYVTDQIVDALPREQVERAFAAARTVASREGIDLRLPSLEERDQRRTPVAALTPLTIDGTAVGCDWPWHGSYATYDGTIKPCCMVMGTERAVAGTLKHSTFAEIWTGEEMRRFREGLINGNPEPVCRGCSLYRGRF